LQGNREPLTSKYGPLPGDEEAVKQSGVKEHFYEFLLARSDIQFVIIENDEPPLNLGPNALSTAFAGPTETGRAKDFFKPKKKRHNRFACQRCGQA
jgi:hypothetical protein